MLLVRRKKWSSLASMGHEDCRTSRHGALARKLAVVLHRMLSDQTAFRFGKDPSALRKERVSKDAKAPMQQHSADLQNGRRWLGRLNSRGGKARPWREFPPAERRFAAAFGGC
jgi:hypothetical protein